MNFNFKSIRSNEQNISKNPLTFLLRHLLQLLGKRIGNLTLIFESDGLQLRTIKLQHLDEGADLILRLAFVPCRHKIIPSISSEVGTQLTKLLLRQIKSSVALINSLQIGRAHV